MTPESKPRYCRLRNSWGLLLAAAWIVFWYVRLDAQQAAAIAALENCDALKGLAWAKCSAVQAVERGSLSAAFGLKTLLSVVSAPLLFIVSHYLARAFVEHEELANRRSASAEAVAARAKAEAESALRLAAAEASAQSTREAIGRGEFIQKLGAVSDLLALLESETNHDRVSLISQGVCKELRDLISKHSLPALEGLVRKDETIALTLQDVLTRLQRSSIPSDSTVVLRTALERATAL